MYVSKWTKNGWKKFQVPTEERKVYKNRIFHTHEDFNMSNMRISPELKMLQRVQEQIQIGIPFQALDELPTSLQYLIRSPYEWHINKTGNKLFRIVDPITQVVEFDEYGTDIYDRDDEFDNQPSIGELYFEERIESLMSLKDLEEGKTFNNSFIPQLSEEQEEKIEEIKDRYAILIHEATNKEEKNKLQKWLEQEIDEIITPELTNRIDSSFCGYGYSAPQRKYTFIHTEQQSDISDAAQQRERFFYSKFAEIASCSSMQELHGPLTIGEDGKRCRVGGYYASIKGMYEHDRDLGRKWSIHNKLDAKGNIITLSAYNKQRKELIEKLRNNNTDEETIRKTLWSEFDKRKGVKESTYSMDGELLKASKSWKDSRWIKQRTQALTDLFMTKAQWNAIYKIMTLVKYRIKLNTSKCETQDKAIKILKLGFERIRTLSDLNRYRHWAEKRHFIYNGNKNTYEFKKSLVDCLSINNEHRWWTKVIHTKKKLTKQLVKAKYLNDNVITECKSDLNCKTKSCLHPNCNATSTGPVMIASFKNRKDCLFIKCENCKRKIWL